MRRWKRKILAAVLVIASVLPLAACGQSVKKYDDKSAYEELLQETKKKNERLKAPEIIPDEYFYNAGQDKETFGGDDFALWRAAKEQKEMSPWISREEAEQELSWLLRLLRSYYGNYGRSGGDEAFEAAAVHVTEAFEGDLKKGFGEYEELLGREFAFAVDNDRHFSIGFSMTEEYSLLGNLEQSYWRNDGKYFMDKACTMEIKKIDGEDPETYLRPAIGQKGELTWYPYIIGGPGEHSREIEIEYTEQKLFFNKTRRKTVQLSETDYEGGEDVAQKDIYRYEERGGSPWIKWSQFPKPEREISQEFILAASKIKGHPYAVIDLSDNSGGEERTLGIWFEAYTGRLHTPHVNVLKRMKTEDLLTETEEKKAYEEDVAMFRRMGQTEENGYKVVRPGKQKPKENAQRLFLVTSRRSASCAEMMTDSCRDIGNTVVIGANTFGCLSGDVTETLALPLSGVPVSFGASLYQWDEDYFKEGRGLAPDLYLTGEDCEERLELFLNQYAKVEEGTTDGR
ncbi:S41 family peptidase [Extibacter muris]|uniref:S41 family peptidase n=1 Tax=Extibacter muris TaxID=1796622 RepID=UPI001D06DF90|nr:S41 family peptidase [Extibacter muris]MCB6202191.1 S41 family peptidase [Extibacter muris]MCQ4662626.1 S41 family peptidase [Extibacter muris]MCQ4693091.1 S41 family peptidase [Extibacter muris]